MFGADFYALPTGMEEESLRLVSSVFKHDPLEYAWHIRLVGLLPGKRGEPIVCRIETVDATKPQFYVALSYTWGDPAVTTPILLEGQTYHVTTNLHSALQHLRHPQRSQVLWIDAICINQDDPVERSYQVQRMKSIYEGAAQVVAWLGPAADDSDLAMNKLLDITRFTKKRLAEGETIATVIRDLGVDPDTSLKGTSEPFSQKTWQALIYLFERPWWRRIWIVQESTAPVDTIFVCGNTWVTRDAMWTAAAILVGLLSFPGWEVIQQLPIFEPIKLERFTHRRKGSEQPLELLEILSDLRGYKATDPKDHVYAAVGLATDVPPSGFLKVDYRKTMTEIYTDTVKFELGNPRGFGHQLDILGLCCENGAKDSDLPSWVPDFRICTDRTPFFKRLRPSSDEDADSDIARTAYCASGTDFESVASFTQDHFMGLESVPQPVQERFIGLIGNGHLYIRGVKIDVIESVAEVSTEMLNNSVEQSWEPLNRQSLYLTGETQQEAYLRTVVADVKVKNGIPIARGFSMVWSEEPATLFANDDYQTSLKSACHGRRLTVAEGGLIGLVPANAQPGDAICLLLGGQVLYVLRPMATHFHFIGECYIHGLMDGEVLELLKERNTRFAIFDVR